MHVLEHLHMFVCPLARKKSLNFISKNSIVKRLFYNRSFCEKLHRLSFQIGRMFRFRNSDSGTPHFFTFCYVFTFREKVLWEIAVIWAQLTTGCSKIADEDSLYNTYMALHLFLTLTQISRKAFS